MTGTARFRALGGAFGALGGDLSAIGINPASSAIFTRGTTSFTLAVDAYTNDANYFGTAISTSETDVSFNQAGGVFVIDNNSSSKWNKITLAFNYDRSSNFDDEFIVSGVGDTSIATYFSEFAQGVPLSFLELLADKWKSEGRYDQEMKELDHFFTTNNYKKTPRNYIIKWLTDLSLIHI